MSKEVTVYWAPWIEGEYTQPERNRMGVNQWVYQEPQSVYRDILSKKSDQKITKNFFQCPATRDALQNIYVIRCPFETEAEVILKEDGAVDKIKQDWAKDSPDLLSQMPIQLAHAPSKENELLLVVDFSRVFFCEESLLMRMTAPWFHEAPHLQYGAAVPGMYDIGHWIRPVNFEVNLWQGQTKLKYEEDEPMGYLEFATDKKINFQRFEATPKLKSITADAISIRNKKTSNSLIKRYQVFDRSPVRKVILKEIKDNLL